MEATTTEKRKALRKMMQGPDVTLRRVVMTAFRRGWSNGLDSPSCIFQVAASTAPWGLRMRGCLRSRR